MVVRKNVHALQIQIQYWIQKNNNLNQGSKHQNIIIKQNLPI